MGGNLFSPQKKVYRKLDQNPSMVLIEYRNWRGGGVGFRDLGPPNQKNNLPILNIQYLDLKYSFDQGVKYSQIKNDFGVNF